MRPPLSTLLLHASPPPPPWLTQRLTLCSLTQTSIESRHRRLLAPDQRNIKAALEYFGMSTEWLQPPAPPTGADGAASDDEVAL